MLMLLLLACCITSCSNHKQQETLNRAESLMEAHPDSALTILEGIEKSEWKNRSRLGQCAGADWDTFDAAKLMIFSETVAF